MKQTKIDVINTVLGEDVTVVGVNVGNLTEGTVISGSTSLRDIIKQMLTKENAPVYVAPSGSISSTVNGNVEAGSSITPTLSASFNRNDAGALIRYVLKKGAAVLVDNTSIQNYTDSLTVGDETISYQATFSYNQGAVKNSNLGNPSPSGRISAGSVNSNTVSISGKRNLFFDVSKPASTSDQVRNLSGKSLNPNNGTSFTITIPAGTTSVVFAYPASLRDVSVVTHVETNFDVKEVFQKSLINVSGANGFSPIQYKAYIYTPAVSFTFTANYTITI